MKRILTTSYLLLLFICSNAFAQFEEPCLAIYRTNKEFIFAALEESNNTYVTRVEIERSGSKGVVTISSDDSVEKFEVEQQCNGNVKAELIKEKAFDVCKEVVDCMPIVPEKDARYCSEKYVEWTRANCEKEVTILY